MTSSLSIASKSRFHFPHSHSLTRAHTHTQTRHCSYHGHSALLQELILAVGYFSVLHPENQVHTCIQHFSLGEVRVVFYKLPTCGTKSAVFTSFAGLQN